MAEAKLYEGGCHCGKVRFSVRADITQAYECNCSICMKRGALWNFVDASSFTLKRGEDALTDYQFNQKRIHHLFCSTCGTASFARGAKPDGTPVVALNLRCLDDLDLAPLPRVAIDGKSL